MWYRWRRGFFICKICTHFSIFLLVLYFASIKGILVWSSWNRFHRSNDGDKGACVCVRKFQYTTTILHTSSVVLIIIWRVEFLAIFFIVYCFGRERRKSIVIWFINFVLQFTRRFVGGLLSWKTLPKLHNPFKCVPRTHTQTHTFWAKPNAKETSLLPVIKCWAKNFNRKCRSTVALPCLLSLHAQYNNNFVLSHTHIVTVGNKYEISNWHGIFKSNGIYYTETAGIIRTAQKSVSFFFSSSATSWWLLRFRDFSKLYPIYRATYKFSNQMRLIRSIPNTGIRAILAIFMMMAYAFCLCHPTDILGECI